MIKQLLFLFLIPCWSFGQTDACAPEDLRADVMETLQFLKPDDKKAYEVYRGIHISAEHLDQLIERLDVSDVEKEEIRGSAEIKGLEDHIAAEYKDLIAESQELGINWKNIEYEEFLYKLRRSDNVKQLRGEIFFQEGGKHYEIQVKAIMLNGQYHVMELERLRESFELHGYPEGYWEEYEEEVPVMAEPVEKTEKK